MRHDSLVPPALAVLAAIGFATPRPAAANEVSARGTARAIAIHSATETLRDDCFRDAQGRLWFQLPGGARFELVTSTSDPAVTNPGDGSFHPFDESEIRAALASVRFPLTSIAADIYVLP